MTSRVPDRQEIETAFPDWKSHSFLDGVLNVAPGLIYVFNQETMSNEYANRNIGEAMGYSADEVREMGADLMPKLCHPDDLGGVMAHFQRIAGLKDGEIADVLYRIRHKDGRWVWMLSNDTVFGRNDQGKVVRHIGMASDITRQKDAEHRARTETRLAAAANDDLRAFVYAVSHELKAPSNTIEMLLSEVLTAHGDDLPDDAKYLLKLAGDSIRRAQNRIEDILNLTRFLGGKPNLCTVALDDVLSKVSIELADQVEDCGGTIVVGPLPQLTACPSQMETLFRNLIENAIRFRRKDIPPRVEVWEDVNPDAEKITIVVRDNGIGIPEDARARIFDMFKRLHLPGDYPGNGLGLAVCRRIVSGHDGDIRVETAPKGGTDFRVELKR